MCDTQYLVDYNQNLLSHVFVCQRQTQIVPLYFRAIPNGSICAFCMFWWQYTYFHIIIWTSVTLSYEVLTYPFKLEFTIAIFIHNKPRIAVAILDL